MIPSYIKDSHAIVVVYDLTNRESFQSVERWIADARDLRDQEAKIVLAGNKADLVSDEVVSEDFTGIGRRISKEEGQQFADKHNVDFFEISALSGNNVHGLFNQLA